MFSTLGTLQVSHLAQLFSLPWRSTEDALQVLMEGIVQRNTILDGLFYDVSSVTASEAALLGPWQAAEGAVLVVPPTGAGAALPYATAADLLADQAAAVRALVVAGVGSSALGVCALARNVADVLGEPAAGVVSGYGLGDVAAEALGGYFLFGAVNRSRHRAERLTLPPAAIATTGLAMGRDVRAVTELLSDPRADFDWLVGHSKGNLVISEALFALRREDPARLLELGEQRRIITLGAIIAMPRECRDVVDIIGEYDEFGRLNSRSGIPPDQVVPGAWHHTNTTLPAHLPVSATLRKLPPRGG